MSVSVKKEVDTKEVNTEIVKTGIVKTEIDKKDEKIQYHLKDEKISSAPRALPHE